MKILFAISSIHTCFSGLSVGFCTNEGCVLQTWLGKKLRLSFNWMTQGRRSRSGRSSGHQTNIHPTNSCKNAVWALLGCSIVVPKVARRDLGWQLSQDFCWGWRKAHFVAWRKPPSKRTFWETTLTIDCAWMRVPLRWRRQQRTHTVMPHSKV